MKKPSLKLTVDRSAIEKMQTAVNQYADRNREFGADLYDLHQSGGELLAFDFTKSGISVKPSVSVLSLLAKYGQSMKSISESVV